MKQIFSVEFTVTWGTLGKLLVAIVLAVLLVSAFW